jgi:hypothetical protein
VAARYREVSGNELFQSWTAASRIIPEISRFYSWPTDGAWFPEAAGAVRENTWPGTKATSCSRQCFKMPSALLPSGSVEPEEHAAFGMVLVKIGVDLGDGPEHGFFVGFARTFQRGELKRKNGPWCAAPP